MTAERDSMTLNEVSVPALGVEERSDEAPRAGRARPTPDPEVVAKPKRAPVHRRVSAADSRGGGSLHTARRGGPAASPRGVVQLASDGLAQGAVQGLAAGVGREEARRETGRTQPAGCEGARARGASGSPGARVAHRAHDPGRAGKSYRAAGIEPRTRNALLIAVQTACGAGRRGAGLPSTGRVTGELLPSSEVNSRAPAAPSNARPGAV